MTPSACVLALDVGGTNLRLAVVDEAGKIHARHAIQASLSTLADGIPSEAAQAEMLETLTDAIRRMIDGHPDVRAVGIGFPGFFRGNSGTLITSPNLPYLHDLSLARTLSERLRLPVVAQNDGLAAALGEFRFGTGRGAESLIHLTLGTGIGGGLILNGVPYAGEGGMAMEIGHLRVVPNGRLCGCGAKGCLEAYASARAVAARYREEHGGDVEDAATVQRLARQGDVTATRLLHEAGDYLGRAVAETAKLLDVHHVSISGGMTAAWEELLPPMRTAVEREVIPPLRGMVEICRSGLADDAGLLGAASLALLLERYGPDGPNRHESIFQSINEGETWRREV
ncbi:MAG TPA: ROK family protein [Mariprofundaceae bacterium]|nr:ROK family protein [Mariprofundaceae bacterium]